MLCELACWSLFWEMVIEPVGPALRLTNVSEDRSNAVEEATEVALPPLPKTRARALPSPRLRVPAPAKVTLVALLPVAALYVEPMVVLPVIVSERPAPMVMVLVTPLVWTMRLPNTALALERSNATALALVLVLPRVRLPEPKLATTGADGANGELPRPASWKPIEPWSMVRFGLSAVVTRPESVRAAVPVLRRVPLPAMVPRKVLAVAEPTVTVAATGVPAESCSERVPAAVGPTSWARVKAGVPGLAFRVPPLRVMTFAAAPMPAEPRRTSPALTIRPPE